MTAFGTAFRLAYTPPYDWPSMRAWLNARALPGVERVHEHGYGRTAREGGAHVLVDLAHRPDEAAFDVSVVADRLVDCDAIAARVTRVLDLSRDPAAVHACYAHDPWLAGLCVRHAGLRVPGGWDHFELACRAVLGQQVSVVAARRLVATLVGVCGTALPAGLSPDDRARTFPGPADVLAADLAPLRMPGSRKATLLALSDAALAPGFFDDCHDLAIVIDRLRAVRGIGDWTAHYIALRAFGARDAFPASDAGLLRGAADAAGRPTPADLRARADAWRPYRAYAAQLIWAEDARLASGTSRSAGATTRVG